MDAVLWGPDVRLFTGWPYGRARKKDLNRDRLRFRGDGLQGVDTGGGASPCKECEEKHGFHQRFPGPIGPCVGTWTGEGARFPGPTAGGAGGAGGAGAGAGTGAGAAGAAAAGVAAAAGAGVAAAAGAEGLTRMGAAAAGTGFAGSGLGWMGAGFGLLRTRSSGDGWSRPGGSGRRALVRMDTST